MLGFLIYNPANLHYLNSLYCYIMFHDGLYYSSVLDNMLIYW